jgi:septal ring factor EnvC (AmiA/AmiB activator)
MPLLLFLLLIFVLPGPALANQPSQERLDELKQQISKLQTSLTDTSRQRNKVNLSLRDLEVTIGQISSQLLTIQHSIDKTEKRQHAMQARQQQLINKKKEQVVALANLARNRYEEGQEARLKLLLNQQDPDQVARLLAYQRYFEQARSQRIKALNESLAELASLSQELLVNTRQLKQEQTSLAAKQQTFQQTRNQRKALLANLDRQIGDKQGRLKTLQADSLHLQQLLDGMQQVISDIPANLGGTPFSQLAHQLPWPLTGKLEVSYHAPRSGQVRWDGVVMSANRGEPVRAIYPGRVIYADWLPGYGLMIIIDQGQGYMTLYGYNENITRGVGDWVAAGDVIAHAGDSGGRREAGLYFGIRHKGRPVNPEHWCNRRVTLPAMSTQ